MILIRSINDDETQRGAEGVAFASASGAATTCAWCGRPLGSQNGDLWERLVCGACGAQTTSPQPTDAELDQAYGSWYRPQSGRFSGPGDRLLARLRGRLARRLARIAPPGPILDVGSGDGGLLDALAAEGRKGVGLERQSTREDVRAADLADVDELWAAIVFWHSLEHLRDAGEAVERACALLEPNGVIVIAMPNVGSVQARILGDRWLALDLPRHLVHVPAPALLARLESLGLRIERVSYLRGGQVVFGWLHGMVGALPGSPDLYDAIRRPDARRKQISRGRWIVTVTAAALALPAAALAAVLEAGLRRGGSVYVEARND